MSNCHHQEVSSRHIRASVNDPYITLNRLDDFKLIGTIIFVIYAFASASPY